MGTEDGRPVCTVEKKNPLFHLIFYSLPCICLVARPEFHHAFRVPRTTFFFLFSFRFRCFFFVFWEAPAALFAATSPLFSLPLSCTKASRLASQTCTRTEIHVSSSLPLTAVSAVVVVEEIAEARERDRERERGRGSWLKKKRERDGMRRPEAKGAFILSFFFHGE